MPRGSSRASASTTMPVTMRAPSGTTTRAPIDGAGMPDGTAYVRRSRAGTGTATWTSALRLEEPEDKLHIFPHVALRRRVTQQVRGMERRHELRAAIVVHAAAQPRDRIQRPQQRARRERAERHDHLRLDDVDLLEEKRLARLDFVRLGV